MNSVKLLIAIEDTDSIDSRGTGDIADLLAAGISTGGWGTCGAVTRHQLLVHPDIPYTSHNSSMCFPATVSRDSVAGVIAYCSTTLAAESEPGSDPGLCVVNLDQLARQELLTDFGRKAKKVVLTKAESFGLAEELGVHLSEHGGTGQGIIGALAGAGLRLTGNDGRFKGKLRIPNRDGIALVKEILDAGVDQVCTMEGVTLAESEAVMLGETVKTVLLNGMAVLLVQPAAVPGASWKSCGRNIFREY